MAKESGEVLGMTSSHRSQETLAAVWRLTQKGNIVQFGPEEHHNYIYNIRTKKKIRLHKRGGSHVLRVDYVKWVPSQESFFQGPA